MNARAGANTWGEQFGKAKGGSCDSTTRQSPVALVYNNATYSKLLDNATIELTDVSDKADFEVENDGLKGVHLPPTARRRLIHTSILHTIADSAFIMETKTLGFQFNY